MGPRQQRKLDLARPTPAGPHVDEHRPSGEPADVARGVPRQDSAASGWGAPWALRPLHLSEGTGREGPRWVSALAGLSRRSGPGVAAGRRRPGQPADPPGRPPAAAALQPRGPRQPRTFTRGLRWSEVLRQPPGQSARARSWGTTAPPGRHRTQASAAWHRRRPCQIMRWQSIVHSASRSARRPATSTWIGSSRLLVGPSHSVAPTVRNGCRR